MDIEKFRTHYTGPGVDSYVRNREQDPQWLQEARIMRDMLSGFSGKSIVDVPVGTGRFMSLYAEFRNKVVGLDISPDMLRHAQAEAEMHGADARIENADLFNLDPGRHQHLADVAVCLRFLNHLPSEWAPKALAGLSMLAREVIVASIRTFDRDAATEEQRALTDRIESKRRTHLHLKSDFDKWLRDLGLASARAHNVLITKGGSSLDIHVLRRR